VALDDGYKARQARIRKRDQLVPQKLVGYPENYLVCSTENEPSRDRETGDLVVPLQLSFDRAKYLALARELASLLTVDEDRCGTVVCDNTFWQTEPSAGVTDQEKARQKLEGQWARGQNWGIGFSAKRGSRGSQSLQLRAGEIYPAHRGWNELHNSYTSMSKGIVSGQYGYPSRRYGEVILILLVDCADDFSRTTWKWFRLTPNEFVDLFGYVWPTSQPEEDPLRPAIECILSASGPAANVVASDNFRLSGPGLTRMNPEWAPFAVLAPFYVSLTQHFDIEGSPIDWFVPHWFIERRLPLPETAPPKLRVTANLKRPNELPPSAQSMVVENAIGMKLVRIPEGGFRKEVLGPSRGRYIGKRPDHGRVIDVRIGKPFLISQTEVTNAQWRAVMGGSYLKKHEASGKSGSSPDDINRARLKEPRTIPVSIWGRGDDLETIREFCDKLTTLDRQKGLIEKDERYTLPTECQWEYAFVAGGDFVYLDDTYQRADEGSWLNARDPGPIAPHPVGLLKPNAWGLYDMIGNLVELCDNGEDNRKWADERCDDPAYGKWLATWADFPDKRYVLRGGHCWEHVPNPSRVGLRVVRVNTKDP
jgi:formylglycine-generating enzyme required for sulfatase activity